MESGARHHNNFDAVRLLVALCVLISHQRALSAMPEPDILHVFSLGGLGVAVFFAMSGFLVAQSWHADPHVLRFAAKRLLRIWPGLAVAVALCAVVLGPLVSTLPLRDYFADPSFGQYFNNLYFSWRDQLPLRFEGSFLPTSVNGSLWTIPLELQCYGVLGLLGAAGLLRWRWLILGLVLTAASLFAIAESRGQTLVLVGFGVFFLSGTAIHAFKLLESGRRLWWVVAACWALAGAALTVGRPLEALWLVIPVTVLAVGNASTPYLRRAGRFGDLSYGTYIYAFPVQQTLIWLFKDRLSWIAVFALTVATTLALAFASWHLVEKRALRLKPHPRRKDAARPMAGDALSDGTLRGRASLSAAGDHTAAQADLAVVQHG
jgi:peptidoglycan/LPS O-acetylase OafA/YrhL